MVLTQQKELYLEHDQHCNQNTNLQCIKSRAGAQHLQDCICARQGLRSACLSESSLAASKTLWILDDAKTQIGLRGCTYSLVENTHLY